jgi:alkylhydroperoxidase family enzyme
MCRLADSNKRQQHCWTKNWIVVSVATRGTEGDLSSQWTLKRLRSTALEVGFVAKVFNSARAVHRRWLKLRFMQRFYEGARELEVPALEARCAAPAADFAESLFRRSVPSRLHALVQLRAAAQIGSMTQTALRLEQCRASNWSGEQVQTVLAGAVNEQFSPAERLLLHYAEDLSRTPMDIDPQVVRELRTYFSDAELVEVTASIAYENFRARFADARARLL